MENYCVIEGKRIKLSDETIKELKGAFPDHKTRTYKPGDLFSCDSEVAGLMIMRISDTQFSYLDINTSSLYNGPRSIYHCEDVEAITWEELNNNHLSIADSDETYGWRFKGNKYAQ